MITLIEDKEIALEKAKWIFGQSVLTAAQQKVGVVIEEAVIAYDDFSSTIMLVVNGGGINGYCLHQGNKRKTPYLEDAMGTTEPIGRGNVHDKLRKAFLG